MLTFLSKNLVTKELNERGLICEVRTQVEQKLRCAAFARSAVLHIPRRTSYEKSETCAPFLSDVVG